MGLLPIIYTSLILFFGLMLIVIIVSYISFKAKAEKNPLIEEEVKKYKPRTYQPHVRDGQALEHNLSALQKSIVNYSLPTHLNSYSNKENYQRDNSLIDPQPIIVTSKYFDVYKNDLHYKENFQNQSQNYNAQPHYHEIKTHRNNDAYNTILSRPRIQIMNKPQKINRYKSNTNSSERKSEDISKFDLLNYYIDYSDPALVTLKANPIL